MKNARVIAQKYAAALLESASSQKEIDAAVQDLKELQETIADSEDLQYVLESPLFSADDKLELFQAILKKAKTSKPVTNLVLYMVQNDRMNMLSKIAVEYRRIADESLGRGIAYVSVAQEVKEAKKEEMKVKFEELLGKKLEVEYSVDPALIGGFSIESGNQILDYSVKGQMESLQDLVQRIKVR